MVEIPHDYHLHSNFSCDCEAPMADMCAAAVARGIPEIGFTEHYDQHPGDSCRDWLRVPEWAASLEKCRAEFSGRLIIRAGIEIGEPHIFTKEAQAVLAQYPFDYVLGSLHWVGADFVFDDKFYKRPAAEAFGAFFGELAVMTLAGGFDVLSHFDLPARMSRPFYGDYDPTPFAEPIRAVLANCVAHGIALDINTAALRRNTPTLTPGEVVLRWYRELGGERITLGSDSHRPANLGANLKDAIAAARAVGFRYVTSYQQRVAHMVPLP